MGDKGEREEVVVWGAVEMTRFVSGFFAVGFTVCCSHLFSSSLPPPLVRFPMFVFLVLSLLLRSLTTLSISLRLCSLSCTLLYTHT